MVNNKVNIICIDCGEETNWSRRTGKRCFSCWRTHATSQNKEYRQNNPEWQEGENEKSKTRMKQYRQDNLDEYRERHREDVNRRRAERGDEWREYHRQETAHRRAKMNGEVSSKEWRALCKKYGNKCLCCSAKGNYRTLTMDHVTPISWGGSHVIDNIQPLCRSCNSSKGNHSDIDYRPTTRKRVENDLYLYTM